MNEERLQKIVVEELQWDPKIDASEIGVLVEGSVVTLKGHVRNYAEKIEAETAAKRVLNVQAVANNLEVRLPSESVRDDESIAGAALSALAWRYDVPLGKVKLIVDGGWIRLEGQVEWDYQRKAAEKAVRKLRGVMGVTNLISLQPRVRVTNVREQIEAALKRDAVIEAARINIDVSDSKVTLRGTTHTWSERGRVEDAAWAVPGVLQVTNDLVVQPFAFA